MTPEERKAQLVTDLALLEKSAGTANVGKYLKQSIPQLASVLITAGASAGLAYYLAKKKSDAHQKGIQQSYTSLMENKSFQKNPGLFHQRFSELSLISPTLAANPAFATKLIQPRMNKGFDLNDVHRLSSIEHNVTNTSRAGTPGAASNAEVMLGLSNALKTITPAISRGMMEKDPLKVKTTKEGPTQVEVSDPALQPILEGVHHDLAEAHFNPEHMQIMLDDVAEQYEKKGLNPDQIAIKVKQVEKLLHDKQQAAVEKYQHHPHPDVKAFFNAKLNEIMGHKKQGAAMGPVSDECLGKMLADTHTMCKEAGMMSTVTNFLKPSAKEVGNYLKAMTIPLVLGVGIKMVQGYMDSRGKDHMRAEADKVFASLSRTSDTIKENPAIAAQAFDSLKSFAPALAMKPIVAKTFIENVVGSQGQMSPDTINMLAQTQQAVQSLDKHTGGGFISGLKEPMSLFSFKTPNHKEKA